MNISDEGYSLRDLRVIHALCRSERQISGKSVSLFHFSRCLPLCLLTKNKNPFCKSLYKGVAKASCFFSKLC